MKRPSNKKKALTPRVGEFTILGSEDADQFQLDANSWGRKARESQRTAVNTLVALGIITTSGKLTKRYG